MSCGEVEVNFSRDVVESSNFAAVANFLTRVCPPPRKHLRILERTVNKPDAGNRQNQTGNTDRTSVVISRCAGRGGVRGGRAGTRGGRPASHPSRRGSIRLRGRAVMRGGNGSSSTPRPPRPATHGVRVQAPGSDFEPGGTMGLRHPVGRGTPRQMESSRNAAEDACLRGPTAHGRPRPAARQATGRKSSTAFRRAGRS